MLRIGMDMRKAAAMAAMATLMLAACAAPEGQTVATPSRVCDQEVTGSHFKRCQRDGTVESVSREDLDMAAPRLPSMTRDPSGKGR